MLLLKQIKKKIKNLRYKFGKILQFIDAIINLLL